MLKRALWVVFGAVLLSGCKDEYFDLRTPLTVDSNSNSVDIFSYKSYEFYLNLGFTHETSKALAIFYVTMFLDKNIFTDEHAIFSAAKDLNEIQYTEAKNIFACTIVDGRAQRIFREKHSLDLLVSQSVEIANFEDQIRSRNPNLTNTELGELVKDAVFQKFGTVTSEVVAQEFGLQIDYSEIYEHCSFSSISENFLKREDVKRLDL